MIAIPLPFILSMLLMILAVMLLMQRGKSAVPAFLCIGLCALTTTVVGLRWTYDLTSLRMLQPVLASIIPYSAWYCFARAHGQTKFSYIHLIGPALILAVTIEQEFYFISIDVVLTLLYLGYAIALLHASYMRDGLMEDIRLTDWELAGKAERTAGYMLLLSASIDVAMSLDTSFFNGEHTIVILTVGHIVLIPVLALAVLVTSTSIRSSGQDSSQISKDQSHSLNGLMCHSASASVLTKDEADVIVNKLTNLMESKEVFLDPDLTLSRISRKLSIPARQISIAINMVFDRNISKVINEFRIERAKELLCNTGDNITTIFLNSGFQTKSNFNREFTRITGQTPSMYRQVNGSKNNSK
ncbi:helix-turn-helix domain-containing protein [Kiloniella antarctica]|uniref:Helix-turn-helix domain-containing protein n=1 Tax=Kiloniella antarctica TaxID=1550907 RepID=A0ABW5BH92_9PROT